MPHRSRQHITSRAYWAVASGPRRERTSGARSACWRDGRDRGGRRLGGHPDRRQRRPIRRHVLQRRLVSGSQPQPPRRARRRTGRVRTILRLGLVRLVDDVVVTGHHQPQRCEQEETPPVHHGPPQSGHHPPPHLSLLGAFVSPSVSITPPTSQIHPATRRELRREPNKPFGFSPVACDTLSRLHAGVWRSLVARFVRDEEVVGSNPATPDCEKVRRPRSIIRLRLLSFPTGFFSLQPPQRSVDAGPLAIGVRQGGREDRPVVELARPEHEREVRTRGGGFVTQAQRLLGQQIPRARVDRRRRQSAQRAEDRADDGIIRGKITRPRQKVVVMPIVGGVAQQRVVDRIGGERVTEVERRGGQEQEAMRLGAVALDDLLQRGQGDGAAGRVPPSRSRCPSRARRSARR